MIAPRRFPTISCLIVLLYACSYDRELVSEARDSITGLELVVDLGKNEFVLGEPVYANARLRNIGTEPIPVSPEPSLESGILNLRIIDPGGQVYYFFPLSYDDVSGPLHPLARGEEINVVFPVFFGAKGWTFPKPGPYTLRVSYREPGKEQAQVTSEPVQLAVSAGSGAGQLLMQDGEANRQTGKFLSWQGGDHLKLGIARLESLIELYPDSVVADYARLAFGRSLSRGFRDYSQGMVRPPDYPEALRYLNAIDSTRLPIYLQLQRILAEASCYSALDQRQESNARVSEARVLINEHPEFSSFFEAALSLMPAIDLQRSQ